MTCTAHVCPTPRFFSRGRLRSSAPRPTKTMPERWCGFPHDFPQNSHKQWRTTRHRGAVGGRKPLETLAIRRVDRRSSRVWLARQGGGHWFEPSIAHHTRALLTSLGSVYRKVVVDGRQ